MLFYLHFFITLPSIPVFIAMTVPEYLAKQAPEGEKLLTELHNIILETNKKLSANVSKMMGADMIIYTLNNQFIYALGAGKNYMSLHVLPMYMVKTIHEKYAKLLPKAKFQKGCINFKNADEMPAATVKQLLTECAQVDMAALMEKFKKK